MPNISEETSYIFHIFQNLDLFLRKTVVGHLKRIEFTKRGFVHRDSPWTGSMKGSNDRVHRGGPCFVYVQKCRWFEIKLYPIIFSQVSETPITEGGVCIFIIINLSLSRFLSKLRALMCIMEKTSALFAILLDY